MRYQIFLPDAEATANAGAIFGKKLKAELIQSASLDLDFSDKEKPNTAKGYNEAIVVFLQGVLGAGKTSFCGGVLSSFGHSGAVKSPTYTLVEPYVFDLLSVYHFDLYRLGDPEELDYMGIRDYFDERSIALIEWPEKGRGFLPRADLVVSLAPSQDKISGLKGRDLQCIANSTRGESILSQLHQF